MSLDNIPLTQQLGSFTNRQIAQVVLDTYPMSPLRDHIVLRLRSMERERRQESRGDNRALIARDRIWIQALLDSLPTDLDDPRTHIDTYQLQRILSRFIELRGP